MKLRNASFRAIALLAGAFCLASAFPPDSKVRVRVFVPPDTPDTARVYVTGNLPILGSWRPDGFLLTKSKDGLWVGEFPAPRGDRLEFKVTLGSWAAEAVYQVSVAPQNTVLTVQSDTTVDLRPVTWRHLGFAPPGGITGTVRYHRNLEGQGLRYARDLVVWLPPSYEIKRAKRYPVLYMHDGQNIFDPKTSYLGVDWQADEVADSLIRQGLIAEMIVVGCYNTPERREEYSDTELGRAYARFVVERVKPLIDSTYRTLPDRLNTAVMGSSMGGLISFLFLWWHPDVFSRAGCLSSAFEAGPGNILLTVESSPRLPKEFKIYLDCGTLDLEARLLPGYNRMRSVLLSKGMVEGVDLYGFVDEGAAHNESAWAKRLWRPLTFLFGLND